MVTVVVGPPCAGKSTYVGARMAEGDVAVDYDLLARALGSRRAHEAPRPVADVAFHARAAAVDRVLSRGYDAWIIHARPSPADVARYRSEGCRLVLLDPGMGECLRRCGADGRPPGTAERIAGWYESPPNLNP